MRKCKNSTIIIKNEIDYDKIKQIVKESINEENNICRNEDLQKNVTNDLQSIICAAILEANQKENEETISKKEEDSKEKSEKSKSRCKGYRASFMAAINTMIFVIFAVMAVFSCIGIWINFFYDNAYTWFDAVGYTLMFIGVVIISIMCSIESWRDNDNDAIQHFNTNVSLVALIVALIALAKGVGG